MANLQTQFTKFHDNIKLGRFSEEATLREKRDAVLKKLKSGLKTVFDAKNEDVPSYTTLDQGSYAMGTGIKPLNGDFDIDIAVMFDIAKSEHGPVVVKTWVLDAVDEHTGHVELKTSCVTVQYQNKGEAIYHVDLGVLSSADSNSDGKSYIAKGRIAALDENKIWKESNPALLEDTLMGRFTGDDKKQFIRCIRYLKRWKDKNFASASSNGRPSGIALTVLAYHFFQPASTQAPLTFARQDDDLTAMSSWISALRSNFVYAWDTDANSLYWRLSAKLPIAPCDDLLAKMSRIQMDDFKERLDSLSEALDNAISEVDPTSASEKLVKVFGDDFPVPEKKATAVKRSAAIIGSTEAG
jgi:hypothetical protein